MREEWDVFAIVIGKVFLIEALKKKTTKNNNGKGKVV